MGEQDLSAKLRRGLIGGAARIFPAAVEQALPLTGPERAAFALRRARARAPAPAGGEPVVTFAIPLVGRDKVDNFDLVSRALGQTLGALLSQTDPRWRAVIAGQDLPEHLPDDPRIAFLPYPDRPPHNDQNDKFRFIARRILPEGRPGHYMHLDADDLLSRHLVARLHARPGRGLLFEGGYMENVSTGEIAPTRPRSLSEPGQRAFWKLCGSCIALPVGAAPEAEAAFFEGMGHHRHRIYPYLAALAGLPVETTREPLAIYRIAHGQNAQKRRGQGAFKARLVSRYRITDPDELRRIEADFSHTRLV